MKRVGTIGLIWLMCVFCACPAYAEGYNAIGLKTDMITSYAYAWPYSSSLINFNKSESLSGITEIYAVHNEKSGFHYLSYMQNIGKFNKGKDNQFDFKEIKWLSATKKYFDFLRYGAGVRYRKIYEKTKDYGNAEQNMYGVDIFGLFIDKNLFDDDFEFYAQIMQYIGWREDIYTPHNYRNGVETGMNSEVGIKYRFTDHFAAMTSFAYDHYSLHDSNSHDQDANLRRFNIGIEYRYY